MRVLIAAGLVVEAAEGSYASTPAVNLLIDSSPIRDAVSFMFINSFHSLHVEAIK